MAGPNLEIKIGANMAEAVRGFQQLNAEAQKTDNSFTQLGPSVVRVGDNLGRIRDTVIKTAESFRTLDAASASAKQTLNSGIGRAPLQDISSLKGAVATLRQDLASGFAIPRIKITVADQLKGVGPAAAAAAAGMDKFRRASGAAGSAVNDFSRIIQDLPFGLVGIGNNLQQLPYSLGNLSAAARESGKSVGSLLLSQLKGFGALGLVVAGVTSAFTIAQNGIAGFNRKSKEAKDAADELTQALESTRSATDVEFGAIGGLQGQIVQVQALAQAVRDETRSQRERENALERLRGISKEYFGTLTLTKGSLDALTKATNDYVEAATRQAIVQELSTEIGKVGAAYLKQRQSIEQLRTTIKQFIADKGLETKFDANGRAIFDFTGKNTIAQSQLRKMNEELKRQEAALDPVSQRFSELRNALNDATLSLLGFRKTSGGGKEDKDSVDALKLRIDALKELRDSIGLTTLQQRELVRLEVQLLQRDGIKLGFTPQEIQDRVEDLIQSTRFGRELSAVELNVPLLLRPEFETDISRSTRSDLITPKAFDGVINAIRESANIRMGVLQKQLSEGMRNTIFNGFVEGLVGVGEAVGNIVAGIFSGNIAGALAAAGATLLNTIGGVLQDIGKQIIVTSTLVQTLKKVLAGLFSNPAGGIAIGIALVALGQVLKSIKFDVPGFATGITSFAGGVAVVGEQGPELVRLPAGSDVIPNSRVGDFTGGQTFIATSVIRGEDIYTSYNRVGGRRRRI